MSSLPSQNAIRQSKYISTKSISVRKESVDGRDLGPLFLTHNHLVPFGNPIVFMDYNSVCLYFGLESEEAKVAKIYFDYTESHTTKQTKISFARYETYATTETDNGERDVSTVVSSLVLKEDTYKSYTTSFRLGSILSGTDGEAGVLNLYKSYVDGGYVSKHEGEVIGYKSPYLQGFNTYFAIVQTNDTKPYMKPRTITLVFKGEVDSYEDLPVDSVSVGSFYSIVSGVNEDGTPSYVNYAWWYNNTWKKLESNQKEGSEVEVLDTSGNVIFDVVHVEPKYELVPLYRLNQANTIGSIDSLDDLELVSGSFGDTYIVKSRDNCTYTSDGYKWYMRAITDEKSEKIRVRKIVGTNDVADINTFYRSNARTNGTDNIEHVVAIRKKSIGISCSNRGEVVDYFSLTNLKGVSDGDMYWVDEKGCYYVQNKGLWISLNYFVMDYNLPITRASDLSDSSSSSADDVPTESEEVKTGIGYYDINPTSIKIPLILTNPMETYSDVAIALQNTMRLYEEFDGISVSWVNDGNGSAGGHFEILSDDTIGFEGFSYNREDKTDLAVNFGFVGYEINTVREYNYESQEEAIQRVVLDYNDFGSFAFLDDASPSKSIARWNVAENYKFLYSTSTSVDEIPTFNVIGTATTLRGSSLSVHETLLTHSHEEVIPMAIFAATYYEISDSIKNFMFQTPEVFTPSVYSDSDKKRFDALNVNYVGRTQEHGRTRDYFQTGICLDGSLLSVYCAEVWLQDRFSVTLLNLMLESEKLSPTTDSLVIVSSRMTVQIQAALANGMIQSMPTLSNPTRVYVDQIAGVDNAWQEVEKDGYALVLDFADNLAVGGGKCITYKFIYCTMGVIRFISGTHAYREF